MKLPLKWLEKYVDLSGLPAAEIASQLTLGLCEVEGVEEPALPFQGVFVGEILDIQPHPEADRLRQARVDIGQDGDPLQIVCGAPNIQIGQKIPVATVGAVLPGDFKIKKSKIRGVTSYGMLCSQKELGLGEDHEGILILKDHLKTGTPLEAAGVIETPGAILIIDNKSLTHRPDCWGYVGLARELGAIFNRPFQTYHDLELYPIPELPPLKTSVADSQDCPCYQLLKISNLKVKDSPALWVSRLEAAGLRSVNNVVDATNLVLLEIGQPLHAFDATVVTDESVTVRRALKGESLVTLDGITRDLQESDLVIADSQKILALAGLMGGEFSGVNESTTTILLEGANFQAGRVRQTSLRLGLRSDSSARFEKGLSAWLVDIGLRRCLHYLSESCPQLTVQTGLSPLTPSTLATIEISQDFIEKRLGCSLSIQEIQNFLGSLGFDYDLQKTTFLVKVPPWRGLRDLQIPEDIVEELGRLQGYTQITPRLPMSEVRPASLPWERQVERRVRRVLADRCGSVEILTYAFVSDKKSHQLGFLENLLTLTNPIQEDRRQLRPTLIAGLLEALENNHRDFDELHFFEIGTVFSSQNHQPVQKKQVAGLHRQGEVSFHCAKRSIEALLDEFHLDSFRWQPAQKLLGWHHPGRSAELMVRVSKKQFEKIGYVAEVHPRILKEEAVSGRVTIWALDLSFLAMLPQTLPRFQELPRFPTVRRDLALLVDEAVRIDEVMESLHHRQRLLTEVELFDIYRGQGLPEGKKSLAFHLHWQHPKRTLTDIEIDQEEEKLLKLLNEKGWSRR